MRSWPTILPKLSYSNFGSDWYRYLCSKGSVVYVTLLSGRYHPLIPRYIYSTHARVVWRRVPIEWLLDYNVIQQNNNNNTNIWYSCTYVCRELVYWDLKIDALWIYIPANKRRWPNVGSTLAHRLQRWANLKSSLGQRLVLLGSITWERWVCLFT